jgi:hypothetical protein
MYLVLNFNDATMGSWFLDLRHLSPVTCLPEFVSVMSRRRLPSRVSTQVGLPLQFRPTISIRGTLRNLVGVGLLRHLHESFEVV